MTQPMDLAAMRERCEAWRKLCPAHQGPLNPDESLALIEEIERLRAWQTAREADAQAILDRCVGAQAQAVQLREALNVAREAVAAALEPYKADREVLRNRVALATIDAALGDKP